MESSKPRNALLIWPISAILVALGYIAVIATIADKTGVFYILFPGLGALSYEVITRPRGGWGTAPAHLATTPFLTAVAGIIVTRALPYGFLSVLLVVASALVIIVALGSPIAPAITAGLLPLVLGVKSWGYPPGILMSSLVLTVLLLLWKQIFPRPEGEPPLERDIPGLPYPNLKNTLPWLIALMIFVTIGMVLVELTGWRFILFPPLVVIAYEMLAHPETCPWSDAPYRMPVVCFLAAAGGLVAFNLFGLGPAGAALAMGWGILILRLFDLHMPPGVAVALLPMVIRSPGIKYPFAVLIGATVVSLWNLGYERLWERVVATPLSAK